VAPFKVGPDFIDPGYHRLVCGSPSINLDGWICPPEFVRETFAHHSAGADIAVIEGVMGLFDGISGVSDQGSTAHVARITGAPVVLVVDAKSPARSAAALVMGVAECDPRVRIAGVIFNNVASEGHARILREALETLETTTKALGFIPRDGRLHIPSRHLGLLTAEENPLSGEFLDHLAEVVKEHVDLGLLWAAGGAGSASQGFFRRRSGCRTCRRSGTHCGCTRRGVLLRVRSNLRLLWEVGAEPDVLAAPGGPASGIAASICLAAIRFLPIPGRRAPRRGNQECRGSGDARLCRVRRFHLPDGGDEG
jgi:cobyrinic acid a,c-diamide synthase